MTEIPSSVAGTPQVQAASPAQGHLFRSFWMAGYEGADHVNSAGVAVSMNTANQHWDRLGADYGLLAEFGIRTIRESIGWRVTELQEEEGFRRLRRQAELAAMHGIEVIWTLMHYGWPADLALLSPAFVDRFAHFSEKVGRTLRGVSDGPHFYQPVNEISFLTWALSCTGLIGHPAGLPPQGQGHAIKCQLVRAALRSCEALALADPGARFMHSDPLLHVVPPDGAGLDMAEAAQRESDYAFEAWDMLCGRAEPALGGTDRHLDIIGVNYYHDNQREFSSGAALLWHPRDARRKPLSELIGRVWRRYEHPMLVAETSHVGEGRAGWLDEIAAEISVCRQRAVPLEGVCLYPIVDRHGWDDPNHWHNSGLWDVRAPQGIDDTAAFDRDLCMPYAARLRQWQQHLPGSAPPPARSPASISLT